MLSAPSEDALTGVSLPAKLAVGECKEGGGICPTLMAGEPEVYVYEGSEERSDV